MRNISLLGIANGLSAGIPTILILLFGNSVGVSGLAKVALSQSIAQVLLPLFSFSSSVIIFNQYFTTQSNNKPKLFGAFLCLTFLSLIVISFGILFATLLRKESFISLGNYIFVSALLGLTSAAIAFSTPILILFDRIVSVYTLQICAAATIILGASFLNLAGYLSWQTWLSWQLLVQFTVVIGMIGQVYSFFESAEVPKLRDVKNLFFASFPILLHSFSYPLRVLIDRYLLNENKGELALSSFFIVFQISQILTILGNTAGQIWTPWLIKEIKTEGWKSKRILKYSISFIPVFSALSIGLGVSTYILAEFLFKLHKNEVRQIIFVVAFAAAFNALGMIYSSFLYKKNQTVLLFSISTCITVLHIVLANNTIQTHGTFGLSVQYLAGNLLQMLALLYCGIRSSDLSEARQ